MRWTYGPEFWTLAAFAAAAALAYGAIFAARPPSPTRAIVKALALGALAAAFASAGAPALALALGCAALGDFFLAFDRAWAALLGVFSFLLTQLLYLPSLLPLWILAGDLSPLWPRYAAMALIAAAVLGTLIWIAPRLRWALLIALPYALLLTGVAFAAMWLPWEGWPAIAGALLWVASHISFVAARYRGAPAPPAPAAWTLYVAAQALLVTGIALAAPHMN